MVYKLGRILGKGSDGIVYELLDGDDKSKVIKFIQGCKFGIKNYIEYHILFQLKSKYIARASAIEMDEDGLIKIVQDRAKMDLKDYITKKKLKTREKKEIMIDLIRGLKFLHTHNIIHGDIKPSNILVFEDGFKFTDFNLSLLTNYKKKINNLYTITYRPPEISDGNATFKSDIWALGCTFFEIYYGYPYFNFRKEREFIHLKNTREDEEENKIFNYLISRMMEKNQIERYSLSQLLEDEFFRDINFNFSEENERPIKVNVEYFCSDSERNSKIFLYKLGLLGEKPRYNTGFRKVEKKVIENKFLFCDPELKK